MKHQDTVNYDIETGIIYQTLVGFLRDIPEFDSNVLHIESCNENTSSGVEFVECGLDVDEPCDELDGWELIEDEETGETIRVISL